MFGDYFFYITIPEANELKQRTWILNPSSARPVYIPAQKLTITMHADASDQQLNCRL